MSAGDAPPPERPGASDRSVAEVVDRTRDIMSRTRALLDSSRELLERMRRRGKGAAGEEETQEEKSSKGGPEGETR